MERDTRNKRWAAIGLTAGLLLGGGALANAATKTQSTTTPNPPVTATVAPATPKVAAAETQAPTAAEPAGTEAVDAMEPAGTEAAGTETADANEAPDANEAAGTEAADASEADGGVDCENGLVKGTTTKCDGGPSANQNDGTEAPASGSQK